MQLEQIRVKKLFGYLSYDISDLASGRSTFIIGNNGSGKSTIFRMISALIEGRWHVFHEVKFEEIHFRFSSTDNGYVSIEYSFRKKPDVEWMDENGEWRNLAQGSVEEYLRLEDNRDRAEWIFRNDTNVKRARCGRHWATPNQRHLNDIELVKYWEANRLDRRKVSEDESQEASAPDMERLQGLEVQFIQANRLHALETSNPSERENPYLRSRARRFLQEPIYQVNNYLQEEMRKQITRAFLERDTIGNNALNKWLAQGRDRQVHDKYSVHELAEKIDKIESAVSDFGSRRKRTKLKIPDVRPNGYEPFLKFYLNSRLEQLQPLTGFLRQVELFSEICNTAFGYKTVSLHEAYGMTVEVKAAGHSEELDLTELSSGEQQIIFLAYQLTIGAKHGALVLIDEPELSLHLEWQKTFISLLERIGERTGNKYICATHSPAIVGRNFGALRYLEVAGEA